MANSIPTRFDVTRHAVALNASLDARLVAEQADPPAPIHGVTFGVATMAENSPHGGERHPDGDEILFLISGRARVVILNSDQDDIELRAGDGLIVPRGLWHRVDILQPCQIVYLTPGPNNQFKPL